MHPDFSSGSDRTPAHVGYALMAVSVFTAFPIFIAVLVAWMNRRRTLDPLLYEHYSWQIRTFWINLVIGVIGAILTLVLVGYVILVLNQLWLIYRVAAGWYFLANDRIP